VWNEILATAVLLRWGFIFSATLLAGTFLYPVIIALSHRYHLLDSPHFRRQEGSREKTHQSPVPRLGGTAMILSCLLTVFIWSDHPATTRLYLGSLGVFLVGFADDLRPFSAKWRFLLHAGIVYWLVTSLQIVLPVIHIFNYTIPLPYWLGLCLSMFVILGAIHSINLIDGMDGLAAGIALISLCLVSYVYFFSTKELWLIPAITLGVCGAIIGFLQFNSHPATIFMGDGGSNWLGYFLGVMIICTLGGFAPQDGAASALRVLPHAIPVPLIAPLLTLAIPILDTAMVILTRMLRGSSPFKPDQTHIHHSLLQMGLGHKQCVSALYFLAFLLGATGIFPTAFPKYSLEWVPYFSFFLAGIFIYGLKTQSVRHFFMQYVNLLSYKRRSLYTPTAHYILRIWNTINRYTIYLLVGFVPIASGSIPRTLGSTALMCVPISLFVLWGHTKRDDFLRPLLLSIVVCVILTAINSNTLIISIMGQQYGIQHLYNNCFIFLAISIFFYFFITFRKNYFLVSPTDFLLLLLPFLLILVPEPWLSTYKLDIISVRSLVMFAAMRVMIFSQPSSMRKMTLLTIGALIYIILNGLFQLKFLYL